MSHIKVALTNLGKYNEGDLDYVWLDLPADEDEIEAAMKKIGIGEPDEAGVPYEETFITDYETDIPGLEIGEYDNLDELNEIAEAIDNLDDYDLKIYKNAQDVFGDIDITEFDSNDYVLMEGVDTDEELGEELVDEMGIDGVANPEYYFDYDAFGRDLDIEYYQESDDDPETMAEYLGLDANATHSEIGEEYVAQVYGDVSELDKNTIETYFDYEALGRDVQMEWDGGFGEDGYIYRN